MISKGKGHQITTQAMPLVCHFKLLLPGRAREDKSFSSIDEASLLKNVINFDLEGIKPTHF